MNEKIEDLYPKKNNSKSPHIHRRWWDQIRNSLAIKFSGPITLDWGKDESEKTHE
tara:strand:- start:696 stop:860 length:165 start_codon:yes stop_codon:yes gene_type:complete